MYSQELRSYSLVLALASLSMFSFVRIWQRRSNAWWIPHLAANLILPFAHTLAAVVLVAQAVVVLAFFPRDKRFGLQWFAGNALAGIPFLCWFASQDLQRSLDQVAWIRPPGLHIVLEVLAYGTTSLPMMPGVPPFVAALAALSLVFAAFAVPYVGVQVFRRRASEGAHPAHRGSILPRHAFLLLLAWIVVSVGLPFTVSYLWRPCFAERYFVHVMFPLMVLLGAAISLLPNRAKSLGLAALALSFGLSLLHMDSPYRSDWQQLVNHIQARRQPGEPVCVVPALLYGCFRLYSRFPEDQIIPVIPDMVLADTKWRRQRVGLWFIVNGSDMMPPSQLEMLLRSGDIPCEDRGQVGEDFHVFHVPAIGAPLAL
jgi:hypothetical protein